LGAWETLRPATKSDKQWDFYYKVKHLPVMTQDTQLTLITQ